MLQRKPSYAYSPFYKLLHWGSALLVIFLLILGFVMHGIAAPQRLWWYNLHKSIGILIIILTLLRLTWRYRHPPPHLPVAIARWQKYAARSSHFLLYTLLLLMPFSGWIMTSASGHAPRWFWLFKWSLPIPHNHTIAANAWGLHAVLAWIIIGRLAVHSLAALKHHFLDKDNVLRGMLPFSSKLPPKMQWQNATNKSKTSKRETSKQSKNDTKHTN